MFYLRINGVIRLKSGGKRSKRSKKQQEEAKRNKSFKRYLRRSASSTEIISGGIWEGGSENKPKKEQEPDIKN